MMRAISNDDQRLVAIQSAAPRVARSPTLGWSWPSVTALVLLVVGAPAARVVRAVDGAPAAAAGSRGAAAAGGVLGQLAHVHTFGRVPAVTLEAAGLACIGLAHLLAEARLWVRRCWSWRWSRATARRILGLLAHVHTLLVIT